MAKPTISLCMIVRDEEANLRQCLTGMAGLVDEIIVVDTGSKDSTRQIAVELGAKVFDFPWVDDFSAARNESRRLASGDYIFWLDADDRIDDADRRKLQDLFAALDQHDPARNAVFTMSCLSRSFGTSRPIGVTHMRLFPNRAAYRWVGRVHERIEFGPDASRLRFVDSGIVIHHHGYQDGVQYAQKKLRCIRLLEQELVAAPENPWTLFYLGRERNWQGNMGDALRLLQRCIRLDPSHEHPLTPLACILAADTLDKMHRREDAVRILDEALSRFPDFAALLFPKTGLLYQLRRYGEAEAILRKLLAMPAQQKDAGVIWIDLQRERWRLMLAHVLYQTQRLGEAETEYRQVLDDHPDFVEAWFALGQIYISRENLPDSQRIARQLEKLTDAAFEASILWSQICLLMRNHAEGRRWVSRALTMRPDDASAHNIYSVILFHESQDWEECLKAHEMLLRLEPENRGARQRLDYVKHVLSQQRMLREREAGHEYSFVLPPSWPLSNLGDGKGLAFSC